MSVDTNAVHESIKLALDAADAATDVTTEYNRVKRDHKNGGFSETDSPIYNNHFFSFNWNCNFSNFTNFTTLLSIIVRIISNDNNK